VTVDPKDIKTLREKTGAGIMDCKKALIEGGGDFDRAVKYLREKGLAEATKRRGKEAKEGVITVVQGVDLSTILMVEVNCETDFVSRTDKYREFVQEIAELLMEKDVETTEQLPDAVSRRVKEAIGVFGENIIIRKIARFQKSDPKNSVFQWYIHLDGKAGVIAEFILENGSKNDDPAFVEFAKNVLLQVASMSPMSVSQEDFPDEVLQEQREIFTKQAQDSGKPENIIEKIVMGRIGKFLAENCLLKQKYVKDSELTVERYLRQVEETIGSAISVERFARFKLGEE
jgi:elongation factor Ts